MSAQNPGSENDPGDSANNGSPSSFSSIFNKIPLINSSSKNFFLYLVLLTAIIGLIVLIFLMVRNVRVSVPGEGADLSAQVAKVGGRVITEGDFQIFELIYNAEAKYSQKFPEDATEPAGREEVLNALIRATKVEILADREGVTVSDQEMQDEIDSAGGQDAIESDVGRYEWTFDDWKRLRELSLLETKLGEKVLAWRLGEFVAVRWDVISVEVTGDLIGEYQEKSNAALKKIEDRFVNGDDVEELTEFLRADPDVSADFSANAIQFTKVDPDPRIQFMQRVVKPAENQEWQGHVLGLDSSVESDLWCSDFACYLTRVVDGNDSKYISLEDYLNEEI